MALHLHRLQYVVASMTSCPAALRSVCKGFPPNGRGRVAPGGRRAGTHHQEGVADPEAPPGPRTRGDGLVLAVHRHSLCGGLAHGTAADVRADLLLRERPRGQRRRAGQPVGPVVPPGVVAHLVDVAVGERQRAKHREAGARQTLGGKRCGSRLSCATIPPSPYPGPLQTRVLASGGPGSRGAYFRGGESRGCAGPPLPPPLSPRPARSHSGTGHSPEPGSRQGWGGDGRVGAPAKGEVNTPLTKELQGARSPA